MAKLAKPSSGRGGAAVSGSATAAALRRQLAAVTAERDEYRRDLQQAFEHQAAIGSLLRVISRPSFELDPALQTVVSTAVRLCHADHGAIYRNIDGEYRWAAGESLPRAYEEIERNVRIRPGVGTLVGRTALEGAAVHILDCQTDPLYEPKQDARTGGLHTMLGVPLLREGGPIGVIGLARQRVEPYTERQVELVRTFADQAVIAIENARLLAETREALEQQTATAEVLQVINSSPGDLAPVFDAMLDKALALCGGAHGAVVTFDGRRFNLAAGHGAAQFVDWLRRNTPYEPAEGSTNRRIVDGENIVQITEIERDQVYRAGDPVRRALVDIGGFRTVLSVALRKDSSLLGAIHIYRLESTRFTEKQVALLQNFAAQAVIAMENVRLLSEIRAARDAAERALRDLKAAQASLIQAEKMASLGQLTAGIAHEIKNPLNFVNNFAGLSNELLAEVKEIAAPAVATLDEAARADLDETMALLAGNLAKIAEHGRRADNIVKSMLEHSRGTSGERRAIDLNALVEESLNLAYHGARAQDHSFNITLERHFEPAMAPVELAPQEMMRVFLNLFGNGFHAAHKRQKEAGDPAFTPTLEVTTQELGDWVEIRVRDNGTGIRPEHRDKLFQPFFTTKPTGEGTGLGLSISYDIVTQQHGGTITVASEPDSFTEFTVRLPRRNSDGGHSGGGI